MNKRLFEILNYPSKRPIWRILFIPQLLSLFYILLYLLKLGYHLFLPQKLPLIPDYISHLVIPRPRNLFLVDHVHERVAETLEVIPATVILALECRDGASERRPLEECLVLRIVSALLAVKVLRDYSEIDHAHMA